MINNKETGNVIRYDCISACINCEVKEHPQKQMIQLGYTLLESEPCTIADCWFFKVDKIIKPLPKYLDIINEE